jgi:glycyl-tRNA synthetase beta chain
MAELLLELFSEEIPARMQGRAAEDLRRLVSEGLRAQGLEIGPARAFATPRRLALVAEDVPERTPAIKEERKGPRVGAPDAAIEGFLKSAGLRSIAEAQIVKDEKRGDFYLARIERPGRPAREVIAEVLPEVILRFPWPKAMRFNRRLNGATRKGSASETSAAELRWVRPLVSILCVLEGKVVPFEVAGIESDNETRGHRFLGRGVFRVKGFADYVKQLKAHKVVLDRDERAALIAQEARALARTHKLALVEDEALLLENAGLTEWPVVLMGEFDRAFLSVPPEVLSTAMKQHQKCFSLKDPRTGKLANRFVVVANLTAKDGGKQIVAGNEKVMRARLADAKFFWEQDLKRPLDEMASGLAGITFHEKLGTQKERVERIAELAFHIAESVDANKEDARRAAQLCKADLVSGMVGEFPELQGLMGRYYALAAKAKPEIARAIELHYKPKGPNDTVPKVEEGDAVAVAVALADKLDTLVGFWAIGEKPTGSGDPYQLRRAALGVIRIVLENDLRLALAAVCTRHLQRFHARDREHHRQLDVARQKQALTAAVISAGASQPIHPDFSAIDPRAADLVAFFAERLKVYLREKGARYDLIDAVFALPEQDDLALIVKRVEALAEFLKTDDGANLLIGVKRAVNIIRDEEKNDKRSYAGKADPRLLVEPQEKVLHAAVQKVQADTTAAINVENFAGAMRALAELRAPVDAFFDSVTVNVADTRLRENRLRLLSEIRSATLNVADFSRIAG